MQTKNPHLISLVFDSYQINFVWFQKVGWIRAEDQTILTLDSKVVTHNSRVSVTTDGAQTWNLHLRQVRESDRGCYMCQINTAIMKKQLGCIDVHGELCDSRNTMNLSNISFPCFVCFMRREIFSRKFQPTLQSKHAKNFSRNRRKSVRVKSYSKSGNYSGTAVSCDVVDEFVFHLTYFNIRISVPTYRKRMELRPCFIFRKGKVEKLILLTWLSTFLSTNITLTRKYILFPYGHKKPVMQLNEIIHTTTTTA